MALTVATNVLGFGAFLLPGMEDIPIGAVIVGTVIAAVVLSLSWWVWQRRKWAAITVTVVSLLNMLSSFPGLIERPNAWVVGVIIAGIPLTLVPLWLLWHPDSRRAYR